jgi:hypothetical protein
MPPIDNAQLQTLVSLLSQMGGGLNPTLMASAYPANVSPAGVKSSFSPEILMASGLVSPDVINQLTAGQLGQLQSKYAGSVQSQLPPEASDIALYPVTNKYLGSDDFSSFMRGTLKAIESGQKTPNQILEYIQTQSDVPSIVKDNLTQVSEDIDKFVKLVEGRDFARAKFDYEQQGKIGAAGPAPTAQDARLALYDKLGVPQMALLGDPNATYQFDPSTFVDKGKLTGYNTALQQAMMGLDAARGNTAGAIQQGKLQDAYTRKGLEDQARRYAENATKGMQTKTDTITDVNDVLAKTATYGALGAGILGAPSLGIGAPIGLGIGLGAGLLQGGYDWLTGKNDKKYEKEKAAAVAAAYTKELKRLQAGLPPTSAEASRIKYSPEYRTAKAKVTKAKSDVSLENAYGKLVADALQKELVSRGITPYQQNMNDLLGYAIQTAKK